MKNTISNSIPALLAMAGQTSNGAGQHPALLLVNPKAAIDTDIATLVDAIMAYGVGKNVQVDYRESLQAKVDEGRKFLTFGRDSVKSLFGNEYNGRWDVTGLVGSLAIPYSSGDVFVLLRSFKDFLAANPDLEIASKSLTVARAAELMSDLNTLQDALYQQGTIVENLLNARNAKADVLKKRMSDVIAELKMKLDGLDARWNAFGLNKPDALETPDGVESVTATLIGATAVAVKWGNTPRAQYYHVFKRVQGVDEDYVLVGSPADIDFTIENLPTGKQIDIVVSAVNNGGESQRSEAVTILTA